MKTLIAAAIAASIAVCGVAVAKESYHEKTFNADTAEKFDATAEYVRKEMEKGGRYQYVKPEERKKIDTALGDMSKLFAENGSVAAMNQDTKVKLFNDQEVVNSILQQRDGDRVICTNQAPIGSHIPVTSCHTYAQEVEARQGAQKQMADWKLGACSATGASAKGGSPNQQCMMGGGGGGGGRNGGGQ
jgi:hypothetical protein